MNRAATYLLFTVVAILVYGTGHAQQNKVLLHIPETGKIYRDFIPKGYDTLYDGVARGDLNKDGKEDIAIVLYSKVEDSDEPAGDEAIPNRILLVLFNNGNGYKMAAQTNTAILCKNCGGIFGDPFAGLDIEGGVLIVYHYGGSAWRWGYTHKFRYQQEAFKLIGKTQFYMWVNKQCENLDDEFVGKYEDINLITGDRELKEISEDCVLLADKQDKIKVKPLVKLKDFDIESTFE